MSDAPGLIRPYPTSGFLSWLTAHERLVSWTAAIVAIALATAILIQRHAISAVHPIFWDLGVYVGAAQAYALGLDPYDSAVLHGVGAPAGFYFTSPQPVAALFRLIAAMGLTPVLGPLLLGLHLAACAILPLALGRLFLGRSADRTALAVGAFVTLYAAGGTIVLGAANNGTLLYCAIALAAITGFEKARWTPFLAAVLIATLFKPFYLAFLAVPALAHGFSWSLAIRGVVAGLASVCIYGLFAAIDPGTFGNWLARLTEQTLRDGLIGQNIYAGVRALLPAASTTALGLAQLTYVAAFAAAFLVTNPRGRLRWAFLLAAATFANPRVYSYDDSFAAIPLLFAAATLLPRALPFGIRLSIALAVLVPLLLIPTYRTVGLVPIGLMFPLATILIFSGAALAQRAADSDGNASSPNVRP